MQGGLKAVSCSRVLLPSRCCLQAAVQLPGKAEGACSQLFTLPLSGPGKWEAFLLFSCLCFWSSVMRNTETYCASFVWEKVTAVIGHWNTTCTVSPAVRQSVTPGKGAACTLGPKDATSKLWPCDSVPWGADLITVITSPGLEKVGPTEQEGLMTPVAQQGLQDL